MAFADEKTIVRRYNVATKKLVAPRPLRLADGAACAFVTDYFTARMTIGTHSEAMLFLVTRLSPKTPIILGIPWLQRHEPTPNWKNLSITFTSPYCTRHCIPWQVPAEARIAPRGHSVDPSLTYAQPAVQEVLDAGDPYTGCHRAEILEDWTASAAGKPPPE